MAKTYCTAIVLAAGSGKRMGTKVHKQYLLMGGRPVLYYSLHTFQESVLIDEVILAAESEGVKLDPEKAKENVKNVSLSNPGGITSIAADISSGRKTECDYISGYVVRTAEKHGIPVPHQDSVYRILRALEAEKPR